MREDRERFGGYCVTLVYPIPLLPSGPGGVFRLQLRSPPEPVEAGLQLQRREWDSNPRWSYPHTRFPSVLLKPLGHLSDGSFQPSDCTTGLYCRTMMIGAISPRSSTIRNSSTSFALSIWQKRGGYSLNFATDFESWARAPFKLPRPR